MSFKQNLHWLVFVLMPLFLFKGCGDLEQDMQDTRTVILNMDFHGKSSSRGSSGVSESELKNQYNTHLILAVHSGESLTDNYSTHYVSRNDVSSIAKGLMNYSVNRNVSLEIPLYKHVKIFAFLFIDSPNWDDLDSGTPSASYYGESQSSVYIETGKYNYPVSITLQATGNNTGNGNNNTVSGWELIAKQADSDVKLFDSTSVRNPNARSTFLENENDSTSSTFMSIGNLTKSNYVSDGKYKFKLVWGGKQVDSSSPPINKEVIWTQTSWLEDSTTPWEGFQEIGTSGFVDNSSTGFRGLAKSTSTSCVIDGDGGSHSHWFNCVGVIVRWNGAMPGPLGKTASSMHLYIWAP